MTQETADIEWLKKEIELLKREVDLLKREIEYLKPNKLGQWQWPLQQPGIITTPCITPVFTTNAEPTCTCTGLQAGNITLNK